MFVIFIYNYFLRELLWYYIYLDYRLNSKINLINKLNLLNIIGQITSTMMMIMISIIFSDYCVAT
jgi:hypothetical protein